MDKRKWSQPVNNSEAQRRAGGRRRINTQRRNLAWLNAMAALPLQHKGASIQEIASYFGCSLTTAYRYVWRFGGKLRPRYRRRKEARQRAIERARAKGWLR